MTRRKPRVILLATAATVTAAATALAGCDSAPSGPHSGSGSRAPSDAAPTRSAPRPAADPLPHGTPGVAAVPAVRHRTPGPAAQDWWRQPGTRVVIGRHDRSRLSAAARMLAADLSALHPHGVSGSVPVAVGAARPGDVRLTLGGSVPGAPARARSEAYTLHATHRALTVTAPHPAGVYYGTRTVAQSLRARGTVPAGTVADWPDRPERGLTVDIARKPETEQWLQARVREMGELKLNELHLHFSDDQGFRIASSSHPEVVSRDHLSRADVRRLVRYAADRHVTVIPEIESPGHLTQVLKAHPDLALRGPGHAPPGAVDVSKPAARRLLTDLVDEYAKLFPGKRFHLGGDEYAALLSSHPETAYPQVAAYARQRYGPHATVADAALGWTNDLAAHLVRLGKTPEAWNDGQPARGTVKPDPHLRTVYWTGTEIGARDPRGYLEAGQPLLNMNDGYLYYVLGEPRQYHYPTGRRLYERWTPGVLRGERAVPARLAGPDRVPGARLGVWCDQASAQTPEQIARGIRNPLRALAERLWNPHNPRGLSWSGFTHLADRTLG